MQVHVYTYVYACMVYVFGYVQWASQKCFHFHPIELPCNEQFFSVPFSFTFVQLFSPFHSITLRSFNNIRVWCNICMCPHVHIVHANVTVQHQCSY